MADLLRAPPPGHVVLEELPQPGALDDLAGLHCPRPAPHPAGPGRGGQHGLGIVMAVCQSFEVRREPLGKRVRAAIVLADGPGGDPAGRLL
ncbi:hypothetical protein [Streptomyces sp. EMB26]